MAASRGKPSTSSRTGLESARADHAHLEAEVPQRASQVRLDVEQLLLQQLAAGQQHPPLLAGQRLHVHRLEQADPHHLGDPAGVVAVALVDLLSLNQRLHVPGLDADHRQAGFRQAAHQPLRQGPGLQPDPAVLAADRPQQLNELVRLGGDLAFRQHLPGVVDNTNRRLANRDIKTRKPGHRSRSFLDARGQEQTPTDAS